MLHAVGPPDREGRVLEYHVPILQHREPLPPYAVNHKHAPPKGHARSGSGSLQYINKIVATGPTNPHRPPVASNIASETDVSKYAPYASRNANSDAEYISVAGGGGGFSLKNRASRLPYNSLHDPHLQDYFLRKFQNPQPPKGCGRPGSASRNRPSSANGRLQSKTKSQVVYKVTVCTGDRKNAATDTKVYIRIQGSKGKLPKTLLNKPTNSKTKKKKVPTATLR